MLRPWLCYEIGRGRAQITLEPGADRFSGHLPCPHCELGQDGDEPCLECRGSGTSTEIDCTRCGVRAEAEAFSLVTLSGDEPRAICGQCVYGQSVPRTVEIVGPVVGCPDCGAEFLAPYGDLCPWCGDA